jgi:hypothetical protein
MRGIDSISRSTPRQKQELTLRTLEEQVARNLVTALRDCAAGVWGMFGRNDAVIEKHPLREMLKSKMTERLLEEGETLERLRQKLGFTEPFQPFKRFLEHRRMQGSNTPGAPKLAARFLRELGAEPLEGRNEPNLGKLALPGQDEFRKTFEPLPQVRPAPIPASV